MSKERDEQKIRDKLIEEGKSPYLSGMYELNSKGELVKIEDGQGNSITPPTVIENEPTTELEYLAALYKMEKSKKRFNEHLANKILIPELRQINTSLSSLKGWISFMGVVVLIGVILSLLGSCSTLLF